MPSIQFLLRAADGFDFDSNLRAEAADLIDAHEEEIERLRGENEGLLAIIKEYQRVTGFNVYGFDFVTALGEGKE